MVEFHTLLIACGQAPQLLAPIHEALDAHAFCFRGIVVRMPWWRA
jgi:hypothetical protein